MSFPGFKREPKEEEEAWPLPPETAAHFRTMAARANYLSLDRPDIGYAAKECCRRMSGPTSQDWLALMRLIRFLAGSPRTVYHLPWQDEVRVIRTFVDTDFAGCLRTRKSTSGGIAMLGSHLIKHWATTQKVIALSSGEAELAGIVKGACEGLGLLSVARDLGMETCLEVLADSSAAIGICRRTGIGKVRHLAVGQLWVQERVRGGDFALTKHPGEQNPADMLTKAVGGELIRRHMATANVRSEDGRPASAPCLVSD